METLLSNVRRMDRFLLKNLSSFKKLHKEYENAMINTKSEIKSKDVKKVEKMAKKELRQQRMNQLYEKTLQELQH